MKRSAINFLGKRRGGWLRSDDHRPRSRWMVESLEDRRMLATFFVTNLSDSGPGSLRQAIADANNAVGADIVELSSLAGTIALTSGQIQITDRVSVIGPAAGTVSVDAGGLSRIFDIDDGNANTRIPVEIRQLRLTGGSTIGKGGAIQSVEHLMLTDSVVTDNRATGEGGGIYNRGDITVTDSVISFNQTTGSVGSGGGLHVRTTGSAIVTGSVITDNGTAGSSADGGGAYFYADNGAVTVTGSTLSGNFAMGGGDGGGAAVRAINNGTVEFHSSTLSANRVQGNFAAGGGLFVSTTSGGAARLHTSTLSGNQSNHLGGGVVLAFAASATLTHSTVTDNAADADLNGAGQGGGFFLDVTSNLTLNHTIVAGNDDRGGTADDIANASASLQASFSLIGDGQGSGLAEAQTPDPNGNLVGGPVGGVIDPALGPLTDNGGFTATHAPQINSPAVDAGDPTFTAGNSGVPEFGQRGLPFTRVAAADAGATPRIDIGAVEAQSLSLVVDTDLDENDGDFSANNLSLREAIELSNRNRHFGPHDEVTFGLGSGSHTITLTDRIFVTDHLSVTGPGADFITISGGGATQLFRITDGDSATVVDVTLQGMTLADGRPVGTVSGGAVASNENLTVRESVLTRNTATSAGGAIRQFAGALTLIDSEISDNTTERYSGGGISFTGTDLVIRNSTITGNVISTLGGFSGDGGGVQFSSSGNLTIDASTISGNTTNRDGGGLFARDAASISIDTSTLEGNRATGTYSDGAGIFLQNVSATVMRGITVSENSAADDGGGIYLMDAAPNAVTITSSTISGNRADDEAGGLRLVNSSGVVVQHTTIADNRADADQNANGVGGGIEQFGTSSIVLDHTIVATNQDAGVAPDVDATTSSLSATFSLVGDNLGSGLAEAQTPDAHGKLVGSAAGSGLIDPLLSALAPHGGPTRTHALQAGSPAIDAGDPAAVAGSGSVPETDQRGAPFARIFDDAAVPGSSIDLGAYERQVLAAVHFVVNTAVDELDDDFGAGDVSLREAINAANGSVGAETITFAPALADATIQLQPDLGELRIASDLVIEATFSSAFQDITIDASTADPTPNVPQGDGIRVLRIDDGLDSQVLDVTLDNLQLTGGDVTGDGGGLLSKESLTLIETSIRRNSATGDGGGLAVENSGIFSIDRGQIQQNTVLGTESRGGGLALFNQGTATLSDFFVRCANLSFPVPRMSTRDHSPSA